MKKREKSILVFLIIYIVFQMLIWGFLYPSTMVAGGKPVLSGEIVMWIWLVGTILLPILFICLLWIQKYKQKQE